MFWYNGSIKRLKSNLIMKGDEIKMIKYEMRGVMSINNKSSFLYNHNHSSNNSNQSKNQDNSNNSNFADILKNKIAKLNKK